MQLEITILEKGGQFAAIGKMTNPDAPVGQLEGLVSIYDRRVKGNFVRMGFDGSAEVDEKYQQAIQTSRNREWKPVFRGSQHNDPALS
jgi:hypothetical protein